MLHGPDRELGQQGVAESAGRLIVAELEARRKDPRVSNVVRQVVECVGQTPGFINLNERDDMRG